MTLRDLASSIIPFRGRSEIGVAAEFQCNALFKNSQAARFAVEPCTGTIATQPALTGS